MKKIIALMLLIFLVGCASQVQQGVKTDDINGVQKTTQKTVQKDMHPLITEVLGNIRKIRTNYEYDKRVIKDGEEVEALAVERLENNMVIRYDYNTYYINTEDREAYYYKKSHDRYETQVYYQVVKPDTLLDELKDLEYAELVEDSYLVGDKESIIINFTNKEGDKIQATVWKYYGLPVKIENFDEGIIIEYRDLAVNTLKQSDVTIPAGAEVVPLNS